MKKIDDWFEIAMVSILLIAIGSMIYVVYENICEPNKVHEATQKTIEYIGFDGKKHQAIVVHTAEKNWVLVEKK